MDIATAIASMKGLAGSGNVLSRVVDNLAEAVLTLEPGDVTKKSAGKVSAAPIAYDLWYLSYHQNLMAKYYADVEKVDARHYDYKPYMAANLAFLSYLTGLKPMKVLTDIDKQLAIYMPGETENSWDTVDWNYQYKNNGIYWINTIFFELCKKGLGIQYPSGGSKGYVSDATNYIGYLSFPIGQLGVMEVISLFQETDLSGYQFAAVDKLESYWAKPPISNIPDSSKPSLQSTVLMFPDMKDKFGNQLSGKNYCFGRQLIQSAYYKSTTPTPSQNTKNSDNSTACALIPDQDVELWAGAIKDYGEDISPKKWFRYWIHKDSTIVPGEFVAILTRSVATPSHVWWFQESNPFLYAGNWVETNNFTSGVVTAITLEANRGGAVGNLYSIKIQGCVIQAQSSDFFTYSVGDRVAVIKIDSLAPATKSFTSLNQYYFKDSDSLTKKSTILTNYVIVPMTFYKLKN